MPVLLCGKEVILAYELLNALQVIETKWEKQVLYFNADILIGKKNERFRILGCDSVPKHFLVFSRIPWRPTKASVLAVPIVAVHLGQFIKLTSSRVMLFPGSTPWGKNREKTKPKFTQKSNPKGQPDKKFINSYTPNLIQSNILCGDFTQQILCQFLQSKLYR